MESEPRWNLTVGLWLIYTPVPSGFGDGVVGRGRYLTEALHRDVREGRAEGYDWKIEPDGSWSIAERLVVLAMSENGDYPAWDTGARDDDGELPIFHTSRFNSLTRIGDDLYEAIEWLRQGDREPDPIDLTPPRSHPAVSDGADAQLKSPPGAMSMKRE
ncbi:hypothetical protein [Microbacterium sp. UBA3486]|uniref:hypothetical protein n=1 Tax=Microbacterium TaxID=33882 RepID=UPI0025DC90E9|nr:MULTISPECIES: hypothetical protein [Microbacterium]